MDTRAFDFTVIFSVVPGLLSYLDVTLAVALASIAFGSLWGAVLAGLKVAGGTALKALANGYTYIMRCTPSIVLLFIVFYGLPVLVKAVSGENIHDMHRGVFAVITFALLFGAYISEGFRAAYLAVPKGQYEAAVSIGLSPLKAVLHVMLPQAARVALPNFGNSAINLLKEGSLAYTIGLVDMLGKGNLIIAQNFGAYGIEIYLACILIYWGMVLLLEEGFERLELALSRGRREVANVHKVTLLARLKKMKFLEHEKAERGEKHGLEY